MAVAATGTHEEEIGGEPRRLRLRNGEIERFERQYAPFGIFQLFDQLYGRADPPQVRHVRDLVALALIGGGMADTAADALIAGLPPSENPRLRAVAQRVLGLAFYPLSDDGDKKKLAGFAPSASATATDTTPPAGLATSAP